MKQSELDYKQETGLAASRVERVIKDLHGHYEHETVFNDEYIEWLEEKYDELLKERQVHHVSYQDEYDDAQYEIGQLQDQLEQALDEIRDLQHQIK